MIRLVFAGVFSYFLIGVVAVITAAYLRKLVWNEEWFTKGWAVSWEDLFPPPVIVLVVWPLVIVVSVVVFTFQGVMKGVSKLAEKAEAAAAAQRKRVGDHRDNP